SSLMTFDSSLVPNADGVYDLGSETARWREAYFAGSIKAIPTYQGYDSITKDLAFAVGARFENVLARRPIISVEYYDESSGSWVPWDVDVTPLFDDDISFGWLEIDYTHRKFRITVDAGGFGQYSHFLFVWGTSKNVNSHTITIERSGDLSTWTTIGTLSGGNCYYTQEIYAKYDSGIYLSTEKYLRFTFDIDMETDGYARLVEILGFMFRVIHFGYNHKPFLAYYDKTIRFFNTIYPDADNSYDIGTSSHRWRNAYFAGAVDIGSLKVGGTEVIDSSRVLKNVSADASIITSGVFDVDRIPSLPRSKISDFFSSPFWDNIPDKPSQFPPEPHTHSRDDITDFWSTPFWDNIPDKPSTFPPSAHTHSVSDITFDGSIIPDEDGAYDLGSYEVRWRDAFFRGSVTASGTGTFGALNISGVPVITSSRDLVSISSVQTHLIPSPDNTRDLGSSTNRWRNLYVVNLNTGDIIFRNGWRITEFDENGKQMNGLRILDEDGEEIFKIAEDGLYFKGKKIA
ncbi:MAG: hypothetical protein J7K15_12955, partial [Deltaproteobacteria bacterium]|nr:hypothetical protein [Deltaproteobacteria bacterium]